MIRLAAAGLAALLVLCATAFADTRVAYFPVPAGAHPHDVAAAPDGAVWYTAQNQGALGILDPKTGKTEQIRLGPKAAPHGVIVGPDGAAWITEGGQNAIARVDPKSKEVRLFPLPKDFPNANLNTAAFDNSGTLWFTGQSGVYGRLDPANGRIEAWKAPKGYGPYGITATPAGDIWFASLGGDYIARVDRATGAAAVIDPPAAGAGPRRIWSDSKGILWVSFWHAGELARYDPGGEELEDLCAAQEQERLLLGLCRRGRQGLGDGLHRQRDPALRPADRDVRQLPLQQARRGRAADARPIRRGLGRRIRDRPAGRGALLA